MCWKYFFISASSPHPTMVPIPTSLSTPTPATEVNSSGAEEPAAMKVAPATSSLKSSFSEIASREGTKKSSQMIAMAASERRGIKPHKINASWCTPWASCYCLLQYSVNDRSGKLFLAWQRLPGSMLAGSAEVVIKSCPEIQSKS